jgi:hypothetical protein
MIRRVISLAVALLACVAVTAPGVAEDPKLALSHKSLTSVLGKDHLSKELFDLRESLGEGPEAYYSPLGPCFYHSWKRHGTSMSFNAENRVETVFLYSKGVDGFGQFGGELPHKIQFNDTRKTIEEKLGKPDSTGSVTGKRSCFWTKYRKLGILVTYRSADPDDNQNTIANVGLFSPEKGARP